MAKTVSKPASKPAAKSTPAKPAAKATDKPEPKPAAAAKVAAKPEPVAAAPAPKPFIRTTGLSPQQQRLQAMLAKAAKQSGGNKPLANANTSAAKPQNSFAGKKTLFNRKAV